MRITYKGNLELIKLAVEDANDILNDSTFYQLINQFEQFECAKKKPEEIAEIINQNSLEVVVKLYKPRWVFSKVLGYFVKSKPKTIFLNARKIYRPSASVTNTIIHEYIHAIDYNHNNELIEFGHNCGVHKGTAPYEIGNLAERIIDGGSNHRKAHFVEELEIEENRIISV